MQMYCLFKKLDQKTYKFIIFQSQINKQRTSEELPNKTSKQILQLCNTVL